METGLEKIARDNWALYHRHPWMLQVADEPAAARPNVIAKYDRELRAVDGIGPTEVEMDSVLASSWSTFRRGAAFGGGRGGEAHRQDRR